MISRLKLSIIYFFIALLPTYTYTARKNPKKKVKSELFRKFINCQNIPRLQDISETDFDQMLIAWQQYINKHTPSLSHISELTDSPGSQAGPALPKSHRCPVLEKRIKAIRREQRIGRLPKPEAEALSQQIDEEEDSDEDIQRELPIKIFNVKDNQPKYNISEIVMPQPQVITHATQISHIEHFDLFHTPIDIRALQLKKIPTIASLTKLGFISLYGQKKFFQDQYHNQYIELKDQHISKIIHIEPRIKEHEKYDIIQLEPTPEEQEPFLLYSYQEYPPKEPPEFALSVLVNILECFQKTSYGNEPIHIVFPNNCVAVDHNGCEYLRVGEKWREVTYLRIFPEPLLYPENYKNGNVKNSH